MNKILIIGLVAISLFSCKKKEFDYTEASTYLTAGGSKNWFLNEYYIDGVLQSDSCDYDDTLRLNSNVSFQIIAGDSACVVAASDTLESGQWRVSSDDKVFYLFGEDIFGIEGRIEVMNSSQLTFVETRSDNIARRYVYKTSRGY